MNRSIHESNQNRLNRIELGWTEVNTFRMGLSAFELDPTKFI